MSANAEVLQQSGLMEPSVQETAARRIEVSRRTNDWNPEYFAREQIRGLVRRVFFVSERPPVKQIVISAMEPDTDVGSIWKRMAMLPSSVRSLGKQRWLRYTHTAIKAGLPSSRGLHGRRITSGRCRNLGCANAARNQERPAIGFRGLQSCEMSLSIR